MRLFGWFRKKPEPKPMEPPVVWKQTEREWVHLVYITERDAYGKIERCGAFVCASAEVAIEIQTKFCADAKKHFSNSVHNAGILQSADEAKWIGF